jgi:hypothetical protein
VFERVGLALFAHQVLDDADSFKLPNAHIRLHGIESPEIGQMCLDGEGKWFSCGVRHGGDGQKHRGARGGALAATITDGLAREAMLKIADGYDKLAERAAHREIGDPPVA